VKAGTLIRLKDGRSGRVVYNGLDGVGIKFGADPVDVDAIMRGNGGVLRVLGGDDSDDDAELAALAPEAMLRDPYPSATLECVGKRYADWFVAGADDEELAELAKDAP
jgi:hypothetical protein